MEHKVNKICSRAVFDDSIPGVIFNENGEANYCKIHDLLTDQYPKGEVGEKRWKMLVDKIKRQAKGKPYDCIVGVSGGTDSSYLLHITKTAGLNPLALYLDNGWSTDTSLQNIKKLTSALDIDLETYVLDYEEIKDILKAYMKAGLPWIDFPTDHAIQAALYKTAHREGLKNIFIGYDFKSEGKQPTEWTYGDFKQLNHVRKAFGTIKQKNYPYFHVLKLIYWSFVRKIKMQRPFYFVDYDKPAAKEFLKEKYDWQDYGGHHHENAFTKFAIAHWLPSKFNIDKRKITFSAQVLSDQMTRDEALEELKKSPISDQDRASLIEFVKKKLDLSDQEFNDIWLAPNKSFTDYPSYYPFISSMLKFVVPAFKKVLPWKPGLFYEMEIRKEL